MEIRFAKGVGNRGLATPLGKKTVIVLNSDANYNATVKGTLAHEIVHYLEDKEGYKALAEFARANATAEDIERHRKRYVNGWAKIGYKYTEAELEQEITASLVGDALNNEQFLRRYAEKDSSILKKAYSWLKTVVTRLKNKGKDTEKVSKAAQKMMLMVDAIMGAPTVGESKSGANIKNKIKYTLANNAKTELHKALFDKNYQGEVLLRDNTPSIMLGHKGVKDLPMAMKASHIRENVFSEQEAKKLNLRVDDHTHYHELGEDFFLKIIDSLDDVTEAYRGTKFSKDSSRREEYFLLVSSLNDKDGNTINVPIFINEHSLVNRVFIDTNKISTVFGKNNFREYINRQNKEKNLVRIKRSTQASESKALIAEDYGKSTSNNSIPQKSDLSTPFEKKYDLADDGAEKQSSKREEKAAEKERLDKLLKKKEQQLREKIARENAEAARAERAKKYTKQEITGAVNAIEALTDVEILSLAKGYELKGMTKAKRDDLISKIYIALHEESAKGESGLGSIPVKGLATKIAWDTIESAEIKGEDGKEKLINNKVLLNVYDMLIVSSFLFGTINLIIKFRLLEK